MPARMLIRAALLVFALLLGVVAYFHSDGLIDFVLSLARGKSGPAQVHIRY